MIEDAVTWLSAGAPVSPSARTPPPPSYSTAVPARTLSAPLSRQSPPLLTAAPVTRTVPALFGTASPPFTTASPMQHSSPATSPASLVTQSPSPRAATASPTTSTTVAPTTLRRTAAPSTSSVVPSSPTARTAPSSPSATQAPGSPQPPPSETPGPPLSSPEPTMAAPMVFHVRVAFPSNATLAAQNLAGTLNSTSDKVLYSVVALNGPVNVSDLSLTAQPLAAFAPAPAPGPLAGEESLQMLLDNRLMPGCRLAASGLVGQFLCPAQSAATDTAWRLCFGSKVSKLRGSRDGDLIPRIDGCRIPSCSCPDSTHSEPDTEHLTSRWAIGKYQRLAALAAVSGQTASCQGLYQLLLAIIQSLLCAVATIQPDQHSMSAAESWSLFCYAAAEDFRPANAPPGPLGEIVPEPAPMEESGTAPAQVSQSAFTDDERLSRACCETKHAAAGWHPSHLHCTFADQSSPTDALFCLCAGACCWAVCERLHATVSHPACICCCH